MSLIKVILVGDCHGLFTKLDEVLEHEQPFDFFVSTGDVATFNQVTHMALPIIKKWENKGFAILGNHDMYQFFSPLLPAQRIDGISVAALNGMIKNRTFLRDEASEVIRLSHLQNIDILVTHQSPSILFQNGAGEKILNELLAWMKPRIYISGHMHEYRTRCVGNTFVFSLPMINKGYVVAEFENKSLRNITAVLRDERKEIRI
jgi:Icc-related predicted phosphoesterase